MAFGDILHRYAHLNSDSYRNDTYKSMLRDVRHSDCAEIGFGSGILSMMALQHSPRKIIAFEKDKSTFDFVDELLKETGLHNYITLCNEWATPDTINHLGVDYTFHEILGDNIWEEGIADFMDCNTTLLLGKFEQSFWVAPLLWRDQYEFDSEAVSMQYHGMTQTYANDKLTKPKTYTLDQKMNIPVTKTSPRYDQISRYIEIYNRYVEKQEFYENVGPRVFEGNTGMDYIKKIIPQATCLGKFVNVSENKLIVKKEKLPKNYIVFALNTATSNNGHSYKLHQASSFAKKMPFTTFISSSNHPPCDLEITVDNTVHYATV